MMNFKKYLFVNSNFIVITVCIYCVVHILLRYVITSGSAAAFLVSMPEDIDTHYVFVLSFLASIGLHNLYFKKRFNLVNPSLSFVLAIILFVAAEIIIGLMSNFTITGFIPGGHIGILILSIISLLTFKLYYTNTKSKIVISILYLAYVGINLKYVVLIIPPNIIGGINYSSGISISDMLIFLALISYIVYLLISLIMFLLNCADKIQFTGNNIEYSYKIKIKK